MSDHHSPSRCPVDGLYGLQPQHGAKTLEAKWFVGSAARPADNPSCCSASHSLSRVVCCGCSGKIALELHTPKIEAPRIELLGTIRSCCRSARVASTQPRSSERNALDPGSLRPHSGQRVLGWCFQCFHFGEVMQNLQSHSEPTKSLRGWC